VSISIVARASAITANPPSFWASKRAMLMLMNWTSGFWNAVCEAVVKSDHRVPMPMTRSASRAMMFAPGVPVAPIAPSAHGSSKRIAPFPAIVSATGIPVATVSSRSAFVASA
jgi:hypothetical protein